jgi:selenophosphate synthase
MTDEHRQHPRYLIQIAARIHGDGRVWEAETRNLSRAGMSMVVTRPVDVGSPITIQAALKLSDNAMSEALPLSARVVWCTRVRGGYQVGCAFTSLTRTITEYLDLFLQYLQGEIDVTGQPVADEPEDDGEGDQFA